MDNINKLFQILNDKKLTIGSCESLSAGLFSASLASVSGASNVLKGALVTYQSEEKINLLKLDSNFLSQYGIISAQTAKQMAIRGKNILDCDICISCTGNAGHSVMEDKQAGEVYIGVAYLDKFETYHCFFKGERNDVRKQVVEKMIKISIDFLG